MLALWRQGLLVQLPSISPLSPLMIEAVTAPIEEAIIPITEILSVYIHSLRYNTEFLHAMQ